MKFEPLDERPDARCLAHGAAADIWLLRAPAGASLRKIQAECVHKVLRVDPLSSELATFGDESHKKLWRDFLEDYRAKVYQWQFLDHSNVVRVLGFGDGLNLRVEFCERGSVREYLKTNSETSNYPTKQDIMTHVLEGLRYLHSRDPPVVHGNLNAGKLFIDAMGVTKIGEFGLAVLCDPFSAFVPAVSFVGLVRWSSPELLDATMKPTTASDIWALGCAFFEIITETIPYSNCKHDMQVHQKILSSEHPGQRGKHFENQPFDLIWPSLLKCWEMEPEKRPSVLSLCEHVLSNLQASGGRVGLRYPALESVVSVPGPSLLRPKTPELLTSDSSPRGFRETLRKRVGRVFRAFSKSSPPSPRLKSSPTPTLPPSPIMVRTLSQTTTHTARKESKTVWVGLEIVLKQLEASADVFPPLRTAIGEFNAQLGVIKTAAENREDYEELAAEFTAILDSLVHHSQGHGTSDLNHSIENVGLSIGKEMKRIREKQSRGKTKQIVQQHQDKEDLLQSYRRVGMAFRQLQTDASLWTVRKINQLLQLFLLQGMSPEEDARYNSNHAMAIKRHGCTTNTRGGIQADLRSWMENPSSTNIYWMNGMAGTGKTTIAYSLCEWLEANMRLGANFFCSRTKDSCCDIGRIVPTIAFQLGEYSPAFRTALCGVLERGGAASKLNVVQQFERLVVEPLLEVKAAALDGVAIVIDGLDECKDSYGVRLFLATLMRFAMALPVKFFVASRPEPAIFEKMSYSSDYSVSLLRLHDIEKSIVEADIEIYLTEALSSISPSMDQVKRLAMQAGNLFIYAASAVHYILPDNASVNSSARLHAMLTLGNNSRSMLKFKELDETYTSVLASAVNGLLEQEEIEVIQLVLWTAVCVREPLNIRALVALLPFTEQQVLSALPPLRSVLHVSEGDDLFSTLHASFHDYMLDIQRSSNFYCDYAKHNHFLAECCFRMMKGQLRFNICDLNSSFIFDGDVPGLNERIQRSIPSALSYACRYWAEHLRLANSSQALSDELVDFLSHRLLFWVEVMNLTQCIGTGVSALRQIQEWALTTNRLDDTQKPIEDALDFVTRLAVSACARSTPHIYVSALPFCSKESSVYVRYWGRMRGLMDAKGTAIGRLGQAAIATWMTDSAVMAVGFSPDGSRVVSCSSNRNIQVWDAWTGTIITGPYKGHTNSVNSVAFSPDGMRIISGSEDQTIRLWDAQTGDVIAKPFAGHKGSVNSVAFSPDCTHVVSGSRDQTIRLWDARTGDLIAEPFEGHTDSVNSVAFSPDCVRVVSGSRDQTIRLWDTHTGVTIAEPFIGHTDSVNSVAFSPDGIYIVSGSHDCTVRLWDTRTGVAIDRHFERHTSAVNSVAFSPDGMCIASGASDNNIRVFDAQTGNAIAGPFKGHTSSVCSLAFSPDGSHIISGSKDHTIRVWDARTRFIPKPFETPTGSVRLVSFSPNGAHVVSGSSDCSIQVWNARTGEAVTRPLKRHTDVVNSVAFSPDGSRIVSGSRDQTIRLWDTHTGETTTEPFEGHTNSVNSVAFSPEGSRIVSGSDDCTIRLWGADTGATLTGPFKGHTSSVNSVAFSPDGARIASGSRDQTIRLWDAQTGVLIIAPLKGHSAPLNSVAFSPDGARIASGSRDQTIRLWDAQTGDLIAGPFEGHTESVNSVAFSPDCMRIVSGSGDSTLRLWDAQTGDAIAEPFVGHGASINSAAFSPDGSHIVSSADDCIIRMWDTDANTALLRKHKLGETANAEWDFNQDGWITLNNMPFVWIPPNLQTHFPLPPHPLVIGPHGSICIENWDLFLGDRWALCYESP